MEINEIDEHLDNHEAATAATDTSAMNEQQLKLFNLCSVLQAAKPILKFARGLLFFKHKWQLVIDRVIETIDEVCPVA